MKSKYIKLLLSLLLDLGGITTYFFPAIGESIDFIWAPVSSVIIAQIYQNKVGKVGAVMNLMEELLPFSDILPSATITWLLDVWLEKKK